MSDQVPRIPLGSVARVVVLLALAIAMTGCMSHRVTFQDVKYATDARKNNAAVVAVIDQDTLTRKVVIHSWTTGIANNWETEPGDMLKQVADIELPQMFSNYQFSTKDQAPAGSGPGLVLGLSLPEYKFENYHATITVNAICKARDGHLLFEKAYSGSGSVQAGKMFFAGAFGMKSAVRQSSLAAYKQIFTELRADVQKALDGGTLAAR
jgi:hypothetical protein